MNPADLFARETNLLQLAPGEVLFKAGESGDAMYVLLQGSLDILVDNQSIEHSTRGDIVGEMALIDQSPRSATVMAREASTLVKVDAPRFQRLIQLNPFFALHVMKVLADRIRRINQLRTQKPKT